MHLASPDTQSSPTTLADWLELQALFSTHRPVRRSELDSIFRLTEEERLTRLHVDAETGERDDGEILEFEHDAKILSVSQELQWRLEKLGAAYPFKLSKLASADDQGWELTAAGNPTSTEHIIYVTCLLIVAYRRGLLVPEPGAASFTNHHLGKLFQVCACLAIGGYLDGDVVSFGWPRAQSTAFLPALKEAWRRFGAYEVVDTEPDGAPHDLKDGGLDVIAWRHFPDGRPARLIVFGQAASGDDWMRKTAREPADTLIGSWFAGYRPRAWLPATIMPFMVHENIAIEDAQDTERAINGRMQYHEQSHGLIFDRVRVAASAHRALTSPCIDLARVDGADRIGELIEWVASILPPAKSAAGAAK
jgi:hypothetical protein